MEDEEEVQDKLRPLGKDAFDFPALSDSLRNEILARTSRHVRRRPMRRRAMAAGCIVAAYMAGALTTELFWNRTTAQEFVLPVLTDTAKMAVPAEAPPRTRLQNPEQLLAQVPDAGHEEQMRLLREAGDIYLNDYADMNRALNCYRQVLELGSVYGQPRLNPDDTWLFASLVSSARKETRYEGKSSS